MPWIQLFLIMLQHKKDIAVEGTKEWMIHSFLDYGSQWKKKGYLIVQFLLENSGQVTLFPSFEGPSVSLC